MTLNFSQTPGTRSFSEGIKDFDPICRGRRSTGWKHREEPTRASSRPRDSLLSFSLGKSDEYLTHGNQLNELEDRSTFFPRVLFIDEVSR